MKKIKEEFLTIYLITNIFFIYLLSYLKMIHTINYEKIMWTYVFLLIINIIVIVIHYIKSKYKLHSYDLLILLMIICGIISTIFAINIKVSLFGVINRNEGLLSLCYYFSIFLLSTIIPKNRKKIVVYTILVGGFLEAIYGILQSYNVSFVKIFYHEENKWITGFTKNPNFFGTIMLINIGYSLGLFIQSNNNKERIVFLSLLVLFFINLLYTNTTSCVLGFIVIFTISCIHIIKNKKYKLLLIILLFLFLTIFEISIGKTNLVNDFIKTKNEAKEISKGNNSVYYGTRRLELWRRTLKIVPENIVNGVGIDNFIYAFNGKALVIGRYYFDKAHNEYLQILITQGLLCLVVYLLFYANILIIGLKKDIYLVLPAIGYLVQAFFNISVIEIAPIFYLGLGLIVDRDEKLKINNK